MGNVCLGSQLLHSQVAVFLHGRMSGEVIRVLACDERTGPSLYASTLFPEQEAQSAPCTSRSTIFTASIAAGLMIAQWVRWLRNVSVVPDQTLNLLSCELIVSGEDNRKRLTHLSVDHIKPLPDLADQAGIFFFVKKNPNAHQREQKVRKAADLGL